MGASRVASLGNARCQGRRRFYVRRGILRFSPRESGPSSPKIKDSLETCHFFLLSNFYRSLQSRSAIFIMSKIDDRNSKRNIFELNQNLWMRTFQTHAPQWVNKYLRKLLLHLIFMQQLWQLICVSVDVVCD